MLITVKLLSVKLLSLLEFADQRNYSGDIVVSENTYKKVMKTSDDSSAPLFRAYQSTEAKLWDQNIVNGEYIIAYELGSLHQDVQSMLPKVYFIFRTQNNVIFRP